MGLRFVDEHPILMILVSTGLMALVLGLIVHSLLKFLG
jgi:hypothetical protein